MKNLVVLISGNGSNLQAIIDACKKQTIAAQISAVFSDNPTAYGLERAKQAAIPTVVLPKADYADNHTYDVSLMAEIAQYQPDLIVLAGYMRILTPRFVSHYLGKIINIHPSLLPKYPGLDTHRKALANGDKEHGTSIHFVTEKLDAGPIILQAKVPIFAEDQPQDIIARVQTQEHRIYPLVINWFVKGRLAMVNNSAFLDGCKLPEHGYANDED
ncbi:MAG TPA: phosphoribosylglycinamide formyltransferase [Arsenophonus apicola]|uniref:phosphoribosylglycinamide formyltransferase n=1 Tax=Arsenophonus apicola TaxID=2879119 RepID=UPI0038798415